MKLIVKDHHLDSPAALRAHIRRRILFALGRFGARIAQVTVRLLDLNGPKGGVDKMCRIEAHLAGTKPVVIEEVGPELRPAVDRSIRRIERAVARRIDRARDPRRLTPETLGA